MVSATRFNKSITYAHSCDVGVFLDHILELMFGSLITVIHSVVPYCDTLWLKHIIQKFVMPHWQS